MIDPLKPYFDAESCCDDGYLIQYRYLCETTGQRLRYDLTAEQVLEIIDAAKALVDDLVYAGADRWYCDNGKRRTALLQALNTRP